MAKVPSQKVRFGKGVWVAVIVLIVAGIGVATRRELYLTRLVTPLVNPKFGPFDANINQQALLTWLHIVPGTLYLVLATLQFVRPIRANHPRYTAGVGGLRSRSGS